MALTETSHAALLEALFSHEKTRSGEARRRVYGGAMDGMAVSSMEPCTACPFLTSALELAAAGAWGLDWRPSDSGVGGARVNLGLV